MTRGKHREPVQRDLSCPTTTATSLAGFIREVETIIQRWTPPRVDWYISPWFRGHSNVEWELDPGWYRQAAPGRKKGDAWYSEHNLLLEFKLRAPRYLPAQPATDWHWLFVMQHYGLPCPSPKSDRQNDVDFSITWREQSADMSAFLLGWFRLIWLFTRGHQALVLENLALRQQLAV